MILRAAPISDLALLLKKPVERISLPSSAWFAAAKSAISGYFRNRPGGTSLTRLSVHCAERMVATSNSQQLRWSSGTAGLGYIWSSSSRILRTRAARAAAVLGRGTSLGGVACLGKLLFSQIFIGGPPEHRLARTANLESMPR